MGILGKEKVKVSHFFNFFMTLQGSLSDQQETELTRRFTLYCDKLYLVKHGQCWQRRILRYKRHCFTPQLEKKSWKIESMWFVLIAICFPMCVCVCVCVFCHGSTALVRLGLLCEVPRSHWFRNTILGSSPLDEGSAHRRELCLTTYNIHKRETSKSPAGFETALPASKQQTDALERAAVGIAFLCMFIVWFVPVRSP
jgi:hypothetical protein